MCEYIGRNLTTNICDFNTLHDCIIIMYLVESLYDVCEVYPRLSARQNLVKQVIPEQLEQVAVASLRPLTVASKSARGKVQVTVKEITTWL